MNISIFRAQAGPEQRRLRRMARAVHIDFEQNPAQEWLRNDVDTASVIEFTRTGAHFGGR